MGPHYAVTEEGSEKGADISTRLAVINHFQHYLRNSSAWCTEELPSNKVRTHNNGYSTVLLCTMLYCTERCMFVACE